MGCKPSRVSPDPPVTPTDSRRHVDNDDWKQLGSGLLSFLIDGVETVVDSHWAGKAIVNAVKLIRTHAQDAGAATENCTKLASQVELVTSILARALQSNPEEIKKYLEKRLVPILKKAEALTAAWQGKGSLQRFLGGSRCDEEFRKLHVELQELVTTAASARTLLSDARLVRPEEEQAIKDTGGYGSVAASKQSYDRLVTLFQTIYRPRGRNAEQKPKDYVIDLLYTYNKQQDKSIDEKLEHLAKRICGRWQKLNDRDAVRERLATELATWGVRVDGLNHIDTFRAAVRGALAPLQEATGKLMLPLTPEDKAQEVKGDD